MIDLSRAVWKKSSRSGGNGGQCVEVAFVDAQAVAVRDSKHPGGGHLAVDTDAWGNFIDHLKTRKV